MKIRSKPVRSAEAAFIRFGSVLRGTLRPFELHFWQLHCETVRIRSGSVSALALLPLHHFHRSTSQTRGRSAPRCARHPQYRTPCLPRTVPACKAANNQGLPETHASAAVPTYTAIPCSDDVKRDINMQQEAADGYRRCCVILCRLYW